MLLNYDLQSAAAQTEANLPTIVLIHGLFGSIGNLGVIARALNSRYAVLQLDLRNHGLSPHADDMNYGMMAQDVRETLDHLNIGQCILIGHSMGGKVAMRLCSLLPERIVKLIVLDIAPVAYHVRQHEIILQALFAVEQAQVSSRSEATQIMRQYLHEEMVILFLMKSFAQGKWRFNVKAIAEHYMNILDWQEQLACNKAALFIRGGLSPYVQEQHILPLQAQFPLAEIKTIANAGHWLHAEKPDEVIALIRDFL